MSQHDDIETAASEQGEVIATHTQEIEDFGRCGSLKFGVDGISLVCPPRRMEQL